MVTFALSSCGSPDDPVVTANDKTATVSARCASLEELAWVDVDAEGLRTIRAQIDDPEPHIVKCATAALRDFTADSPAETARLLNPLLRDPDPLVLTAVAKALGDPWWDPPGNARSAKLLEQVAVKGLSGEGADKRWAEARAAAVLALAALGDRHAEAIMMRMLHNEPPRNAEAAALALVRLLNIGQLLQLLEDPNNWRLVYPLVDLKSARFDAALIAVLNRSDNPTIAEYYVNHGDRRLRQAANRWADAHGYWFGVTPAQVR